MELSPLQMQAVERLFAAGLRPIAIPIYQNALCLTRGRCGVVLAPVQNGGLSVVAPPTVLVNGNLGVQLKRSSGDVFVWKKIEMPATPDLLAELEAFRSEVSSILAEGPNQ